MVLSFINNRNAGATQVRFNRVNEFVLASSHDTDVRVWDLRKGSKPTTLITAHKTKIYGLDYSPENATTLLTCSQDQLVKIWNTEQPRSCLSSLDTGTSCWRARFTPFGDGNGILTMAQRGDDTLRLWNRKESGLVYRFEGHRDTPMEFVWRYGNQSRYRFGRHDDEEQLVTWGKDMDLRIWNVGKEIRDLVEENIVEDAFVVTKKLIEKNLVERDENGFGDVLLKEERGLGKTMKDREMEERRHDLDTSSGSEREQEMDLISKLIPATSAEQDESFSDSSSLSNEGFAIPSLDSIYTKASHNVPFPRLCSATFSPSGTLVFFFSELSLPNSGDFTAYSVLSMTSTGSKQPVLRSRKYNEKPRSYSVYLPYRRFMRGNRRVVEEVVEEVGISTESLREESEWMADEKIDYWMDEIEVVHDTPTKSSDPVNTPIEKEETFGVVHLKSFEVLVGFSLDVAQSSSIKGEDCWEFNRKLAEDMGRNDLALVWQVVCKYCRGGLMDGIVQLVLKHLEDTNEIQTLVLILACFYYNPEIASPLHFVTSEDTTKPINRKSRLSKKNMEIRRPSRNTFKIWNQSDEKCSFLKSHSTIETHASNIRAYATFLLDSGLFNSRALILKMLQTDPGLDKVKMEINYCAICRLKCTGLTTVCPLCGCGGCRNCMTSWRLNQTGCVNGCDCNCATN